MPPKPAHILAASGHPTGRQAVWLAIREIGEFTLRDLWLTTNVDRATVRTYVESLAKAGILETFSSGKATSGQKGQQPTVFKLVRDCGIEAPRVDRDGNPVIQGAAREQMWRTMKMVRGDFTSEELAIAASLEDSPVSPVDAKDYLRHLAVAGYLAITQRGRSGKPGRYRFNPAKNTGPKPPMIQRMQTVFDPNLGKIVWHPQVDA